MISTWNERCGIAYYTSELTKELAKYVNVNIVKIKVSKFPHRRFRYFLNLAKEAKKNCSLIHIQHEFAFFEGGLFKKYFNYINMVPFFIRLAYPRRIKTVVTLHTIPDWDKPTSFISKLWRRFLLRLIFNCADYIIVHNDVAKKRLMKLGAKEKQLYVIPHGTLEPIAPLNKVKCKEELNLMGKTVITIFGFIYPSKGYEIALKALKDLPNNTVLLIAGALRSKEYEEYYENLKKIVMEFCLNDRVIFYGFVPDDKIPIIFGATDIGLLPYTQTTESGVLHLLLAYGVPTLTSDLEPFREIRSSWNCIEIFKAGSSEDLAKKVIWLMENEEARMQLSKNAREFCLETSWKNIGKKHLTLYSILLENKLKK